MRVERGEVRWYPCEYREFDYVELLAWTFRNTFPRCRGAIGILLSHNKRGRGSVGDAAIY